MGCGRKNSEHKFRREGSGPTLQLTLALEAHRSRIKQLESGGARRAHPNQHQPSAGIATVQVAMMLCAGHRSEEMKVRPSDKCLASDEAASDEAARDTRCEFYYRHPSSPGLGPGFFSLHPRNDSEGGSGMISISETKKWRLRHIHSPITRLPSFLPSSLPPLVPFLLSGSPGAHGCISTPILHPGGSQSSQFPHL